MYSIIILIIRLRFIKLRRDKENYMAKRSTNLGIKPKSIHSRKTKKRLAIKKVMLAKKAAKKTKNRSK